LFVAFVGSRSSGNHSLNRASFNIFFLYENLEALKWAKSALVALAKVGGTFVHYISQLRRPSSMHKMGQKKCGLLNIEDIQQSRLMDFGSILKGLYCSVLSNR
jgi:hypothetical protein